MTTPDGHENVVVLGGGLAAIANAQQVGDHLLERLG